MKPLLNNPYAKNHLNTQQLSVSAERTSIVTTDEHQTAAASSVTTTPVSANPYKKRNFSEKSHSIESNKTTTTTTTISLTGRNEAMNTSALSSSGSSSVALPVAPEPITKSTLSSSTTAAAEHSTTPRTTATSEAASALVIAASDKAGMDGIDRARIDAIILRESGNSLFMQQQRKRDDKVNEKIAQYWQKLHAQNAKHPRWKETLQYQIDETMVTDIVSKRSCCVVVDMDMFYMACELLSRPDLKDVPACVGGSMITTSNYKARRYGVRSAMAGWIGDKLVSELSNGKERLVHVPHHFDLYREKSQVVRQVLAEYDPNLRAYSLDEVYMNLAPYLSGKLAHPDWNHERIQLSLQQSEQEIQAECLTEDLDKEFDSRIDKCMEILLSFPSSACAQAAEEVVREMRARVEHATGGLTCSAGMAPNFMLAKIASDFNKPNGQYFVAPSHDAITTFLHPLPTRKVPGVGRVTDKILHAFGITTVQELYEQRALVQFLFQPATARNLLHASMGCSTSDGKQAESSDENDAGQKGISRERTFSAASHSSWSEISSRLEDVARLLADDMVRKNLWARTITVKVKLHTFDLVSRSKSLPRGVFVQSATDLTLHAVEMLREIRNSKEYKNTSFSVRLLGIRCSNFRDEQEHAHQKSLDDFLQDSPFPKQVTSPIPRPRQQLGPNQRTIETYLKNRNMNATQCTQSVQSLQTDLPLEVNTCAEIAASGAFTNSCEKDPRDAPEHEAPARTHVHDKSAESSNAELTTTVKHVDHSAMKEEAKPSHAATEGVVHCPICNKGFSEQANDELNRHVDACLSGSVVRQVIRQESAAVSEEAARSSASHTCSVPLSKKRRLLIDFFHSS